MTDRHKNYNKTRILSDEEKICRLKKTIKQLEKEADNLYKNYLTSLKEELNSIELKGGLNKK